MLQRFSIEYRTTKTKPITRQLDYSATLKTQYNQNHSNCLITFDTQLKTTLIKCCSYF